LEEERRERTLEAETAAARLAAEKQKAAVSIEAAKSEVEFLKQDLINLRNENRRKKTTVVLICLSFSVC